jgi:leader peptidase (prepilin peptidase) / N-methyltransferase
MNGLVSVFSSFLGACLGAVAGSFLNVVIHRVPRLIDAGDGRVSLATYISGLAWPPSHCPSCGHHLNLHDNIPIISYVALGGRCRFCRASYGARYLLVELLTAAAFAYCTFMFGLTPKAFLGAIFIAGLVALSVIDIEEQLLPDAVLAPLFCLGLAFHLVYGGGMTNAALGAAAGYAVLWLIRESYRLYAGTEGMGYGDVKLAATIGIWVGIEAIPAVLFIAFAGGVALTLPLALLGRVGKGAPVPFGPFLAFGGLCAFLVPNLGVMGASIFFPA